MASSITPALKSSARSAYRALFRASGATFAGDDRVLYAFRDKVRTETVVGRQEADPAEYEARVKHAFEVADVLKKNVVQAEKQGEGEDTAWKLRVTSDTELGSNEGVKAPYSRPTRGQPRLKCGEDPNAVAPLPPRSLRHMTESNPTRSYSTAASSSSSPPNPNPDSAETEYDRVRVQSLRDRLHEVNRRVLASPTGREFMTERTLVEDKLGALAARMEFLASDMHDQIYPPSSNPAPAQTLVDLLLDHRAHLSSYIRFLQNAAKYTTAVRTEELSLSPEARKAIAGLVEIPSPVITKSHTVPYSEIEAMADALRMAMHNISYAQECVEDLESNGPRVEDARTLVEEIEKSAGGSYLLELGKEVERRLEAGAAWGRVEEVIVGYGLSSARTRVFRRVYRRIREYEESFPRLLQVVAKAQEEDNMKRAKRRRRNSFARSRRILFSQLDLVKELLGRALAADKHLEQYAWRESGIWEMDMDRKDLYFDARMELVIIYDAAWRVEKMMKQGVEGLREASVPLRKEVQSEFEDPRGPKQLQANFSS
ncbi:hypothetical protein RSAG8_02134, partial [Rhizoctonia solani AG-8 WAC10335]